MSETQPTVITVNRFKTAGLEPEGIYRLSIDAMAVEQRTVQQGANAGQKYKTIAGRVQLVELFGEGLVENPSREFLNCGVSGKGLQRFYDLYIAAFGSIEPTDLNEAGEPTVTLDDLAAALVGVDTVWTTYYWKRNKNNPEEIEGSLGWSFSADPSKLRAPIPFEEREKKLA